MLQPIPWQQRTLFIPYQPNRQAPAWSQIARIQLLISRTGTNDWSVLQSAEPNVQGFTYHAPEDGDFWFALQHLDATGQVLDGAQIAPQLHLVITTQPSATIPTSSATAPPPAEPASEPPREVPSVSGGRSPFASGNPFQTAAKPTQDWPASNRLPATDQSMTPLTEIPPVANSYTPASEGSPRRTPAKFAADIASNSGASNTEIRAPNLHDEEAQSPERLAQRPAATESEWSSAGSQDGPMVLNSHTFDVEYDLQAVGSWGIAKVELWGTQDEGATWQSFGIDPDNRSPIRVTVPHSGTFGFRIVVQGANSLAVESPQAGDKPEIVVMVDLEPPTVDNVALEPGSGNLADQLRIRWTANDRNLETRPISLHYSSYAEGPWSTIATALENAGVYDWRIERHIPGRFFLRLEARDAAGNVATYQSPAPIELDRPQPTGTLRSVRPVNEVSAPEK